MFTWPIGTQAINATPVLRELDAYHQLKASDVKVATMGKILSTPHRTRVQQEVTSRSFSPLRFLWWASLLVGTRAQSTTAFPASMELSALAGTNGFVLNGEQTGDATGWSVASAGDVNGDGIADLLIGARYANSKAGKSYVVFGRVGLGRTGSFALSSLDGTNGFVLNGEQAGDRSGYSVACAGDVNGDDIADLLIGAYSANSFAGKSYVVFGRIGLGSTGSLALSSLDGMNGFVLTGEQASDSSGSSVASAGDVNGDGIDDLLIGANIASSGAGKSYVIFGKVGLGSTGSLALSSLNGTNGFVLNGQASDQCGFSVASAGDVNGDGIADLLIGAPYANPGAGKSYVVLGRVGLGSTGSLAVSSLDGKNGFVLNGEQSNDFSGNSVARAGDVNGDQIADLLVGANQVKSGAGKCYVVFGPQTQQCHFSDDSDTYFSLKHFDFVDLWPVNTSNHASKGRD